MADFGFSSLQPAPPDDYALPGAYVKGLPDGMQFDRAARKLFGQPKPPSYKNADRLKAKVGAEQPHSPVGKFQALFYALDSNGQPIAHVWINSEVVEQ